MKTWNEQSATFTELDQTIVVGRPALVACFFGNAGLEDAAIPCFDEWRERFPPKTPLYYSHDNTKRIMKLTPKAVSKVHDVFSPTKLVKEAQFYYFKDAEKGGPSDECHGHSFEMLITASVRSYILVSMPLETDTAELATMFKDWCGRFNFSHATAGFGFEVAWFQETAQPAYPLMLRVGLRFHGVRVFHRQSVLFCQAEPKTMDTVSWLNFVGPDALEELGSDPFSNLAEGVIKEDLGEGVFLQAGQEPNPCDVNRPGDALTQLRSINAALRPIRTAEWELKNFTIDPANGYAVDPEKEQSWLERLDE